ncbi:MAG: hypothetical protein WC312_02370 [Candidatus Omnitrophota bacterium]|jgi:hypothetical protein
MKNSAKIYFVITIDTEADHSFNWKKSDPLTFKSLTESIPRTIQPLFERYGAIGTYLLTAEVLEDDVSINILKSIDRCELGTHLHPEYVEPQKKYYKYSGTTSSEFSNNYDPVIEMEKISNLTKLFQERIGYAPLVYRGGKFGFSLATASSLSKLGYLIDTSVTPGISWEKIGGPDFRNLREQPYFIKNIKDSGNLLEVPVTIMSMNILEAVFNRATWLRPSFSSVKDMKQLMDKVIKIRSHDNAIVLNMMFHSMEFYPGASPYASSMEGCNSLISKIEDVLKYCKKIGAEFCKLSHIRTIIK